LLAFSSIFMQVPGKDGVLGRYKFSRRCGMKKMMIAACAFFFLFAIAIPVMSKDVNRNTQGGRNYKARPDNPGHSNYKNRPDYQNQRGYRQRPYDSRRHYNQYDYSGHRYAYHGHWRSWQQWNAYAKSHPNIYKHGTYYRENAHLMFRFCDPGFGSCFFFSIGR
jgi:hypothetical protein